MRWGLGIALAGLLFGATPSTAARTSCEQRDAREMLRAAGQGLNGRVVEMRDDRLVIVAESRYDEASIAFGERVTVYGRSLPARLQGRVGIVVHRRDDQWTATSCDVVPGARIARALRGDDPCPAPRARLSALDRSGRRVTVTLSLAGDVTDVRVEWDLAIRRTHLTPGTQLTTMRHRFRSAGRHRIRIRAYGAKGPGCGRENGFGSTAIRRSVRTP